LQLRVVDPALSRNEFSHTAGVSFGLQLKAGIVFEIESHMSTSPVIPINSTQQDHVVEQTVQLINKAAVLFDKKLAPVPVLFDLRGRAAGMFRIRLGQPQIRYNPWIFARYFASNMADTIPHEVAHYVVNELFGHHGIRPHGIEWQKVMLAFGRTPQVTCSYDLSGIPQRKVKRFDYHCACGNHQLTSYRHNRIAGNRARYLCRKCRQPLQQNSPN
jgi:SprT protein